MLSVLPGIPPLQLERLRALMKKGYHQKEDLAAPPPDEKVTSNLKVFETCGVPVGIK